MSVDPDQPPPWPPIADHRPARHAARAEPAEPAGPAGRGEPGEPEFGRHLLIRGAVVAVVLAAVALVAAWFFTGGGSPAEANQPAAHTDSSTAVPDATVDDTSHSDKSPSSSSSSASPSETERSKSRKPPDDPPGTHSRPGHGPVPSAPNDFDAWYTYQGYQAMWQPPSNDGGSAITSYVLSDCHGDVMATVDGDANQASFDSGRLDCISIHAVNANGAGHRATIHPDN